MVIDVSVVQKSARRTGALHNLEGQLGNDRGRMEFVNRLVRDYPESAEARKVLSSG